MVNYELPFDSVAYQEAKEIRRHACSFFVKFCTQRSLLLKVNPLILNRITKLDFNLSIIQFKFTELFLPPIYAHICPSMPVFSIDLHGAKH